MHLNAVIPGGFHYHERVVSHPWEADGGICLNRWLPVKILNKVIRTFAVIKLYDIGPTRYHEVRFGVESGLDIINIHYFQAKAKPWLESYSLHSQPQFPT